ncbi:ATP-binding protein [bacterium]|nr:ATP-binding protein [bacterium]
MSADQLVMEFDPNTIEHLGINQYSKLPSVIAELIANSYDAEASEVLIYLNDSEKDKDIIIDDNGHGMTFDQINERFLKIGRNRRAIENSEKSEFGKRWVIGKKGIGKLSFFGIASHIQVETIRDYVKNVFVMDLNKLKEASQRKEPYRPEVLVRNQKSDQQKGTVIKMTNLKRKSPFDKIEIAYSLSRYFNVFDEPSFCVKIIHNDDTKNALKIENKFKYESLDAEFTWTIPIKDFTPVKAYDYGNQINGQIISAKKTVPSYMEGIALFSRGKLANENNFYDAKSSSFGFKYLTGWLNVDFIEQLGKDVIATNRRSLNWEDEDTEKLKDYLTDLIYHVYNEQRKYKVIKKKEKVREITGIDIDEWISSIANKHDQSLARKIIKPIIDSDGIETEKAAELVEYIRDSFQFESFKEFAAEIAEIDDAKNETLIKLLKDWEIIEAREFYKLSMVRVKAIKTFRKYIDENALEIPVLHNFFKSLPWLLDPRIREFKDEIHFSDLLKQEFSEADEPVTDRRIDFLCTSVANNRFVIELKRPKHRLRKKDIEQAQDYRLFVEEHTGNDQFSSKDVVAYIVCGDRNRGNKKLEELVDMWQGKGKIYVSTYSDLLINAEKYHQEFIDSYEKLKSNIKSMDTNMHIISK